MVERKSVALLRGKNCEKYNFEGLTLRKEEVGLVRLPYKIMLRTDKCIWGEEPNPVRVLGKTLLSPGWFGWLI